MNLKKGRVTVNSFGSSRTCRDWSEANNRVSIGKKEFEQYGRSLCVRIDNNPTVDNETSDEVLNKMKSLIKESSCNIPDVVNDRTHRIREGYNDKKQM